ncbi:MAG: hypothetical protein FWF57_04275 [Defluviitaleaceae bacterium]|nr:hypothetical protein [Defluviitaleaceae bacterium]
MIKSRKKILNTKSRGFSYIEILISMFLISIVIFPIIFIFFSIQKLQISTYNNYNKSILATSLLTEVINNVKNISIHELSSDNLNKFSQTINYYNFDERYKTDLFEYEIEINFKNIDIYSQDGLYSFNRGMSSLTVNNIVALPIEFFVKVIISSESGEIEVFRNVSIFIE